MANENSSRPSRGRIAAWLGLGAAAALLLWFGLLAALDATSSEALCLSCHAMREQAWREYSASTHYRNAKGVRATCADCHIPKAAGPKILAKLGTFGDLYHQLAGTIDTPEKYEARRLTLARRVWDRMLASDSRECRGCHSDAAFDFDKMRKPDEARHMKKGMSAGETCISCHKGIVHKMPDLTQGYRALIREIGDAAAQARPGEGATLRSFRTALLYAQPPAGAPGADGAAGDGKLLAATPVTVLELRQAWARVRIDGWQQQGAERVVYALRGQRILQAALGEALTAQVKADKPAEDPETGLVWASARLEAWVATADLSADAAGLQAYGAELYRSHCGTCHNLPPPDHWLANQVIGVLNAMKRFVAIEDEEYRFLQKYLQLNAKDTGGKPHG